MTRTAKNAFLSAATVRFASTSMHRAYACIVPRYHGDTYAGLRVSYDSAIMPCEGLSRNAGVSAMTWDVATLT